jgi:hypothetical protein
MVRGRRTNADDVPGVAEDTEKWAKVIRIANSGNDAATRVVKV